jgi:hypothetical protein
MSIKIRLRSDFDFDLEWGAPGLRQCNANASRHMLKGWLPNKREIVAALLAAGGVGIVTAVFGWLLILVHNAVRAHILAGLSSDRFATFFAAIPTGLLILLLAVAYSVIVYLILRRLRGAVALVSAGQSTLQSMLGAKPPVGPPAAPSPKVAPSSSDELLDFMIKVQRWLELRLINQPNARKDYPHDSALQAMLSLPGSRSSQYGYETVAEYKHTFHPTAITIYNSLVANALGGHPKCTTYGRLKMYQGSVAT